MSAHQETLKGDTAGMPTTKVTFTNRHGRTLAARLETPSGPRLGVALAAHCFACSKNLSGLVRLSRSLADAGFAVLRFDFTGLGESEGEAFEGGLGGDASDLLDAAAWLDENLAPVDLLIGHSLGGLAALQAAPELQGLAGVATLGTPSDPQHITQHLTPTSDPQEDVGVDVEGRRQVQIAGRTFALGETFFQELERRSPAACLQDISASVMILHAVTDEVVGIRHAETLFKAAKHPKSFVSLGQADHLLTRPDDARFAASVLAGWARGLLAEPHDTAASATETPAVGTAGGHAAPLAGAPHGTRDPGADPSEVRVSTGGSYATDAQVAGFPMRMDEPLDVGGSDTGPNPGALLRASLASCTSITLRMYANRKEWPLDAVDVSVDSTSERQDGVVHTRMTRRVTLHGDLTDEQRARLIDIADRCPVHRTLEGEIEIVTEEA
jgi:putative redox protein